ncbi:hypothetical protein DIS13_09190 [Weissella paramesenteroides]|nr:hypothetical protein DIS13_09190 [Weissella paramesenteroides]
MIEVTQITKESSCNPLSGSGILNLQYEFEEVLVDDQYIDFNRECWWSGIPRTDSVGIVLGHLLITSLALGFDANKHSMDTQ